MPSPHASFGPLLRRWRQDRRLSQEALADFAEVSTRHLSCLEAAKAAPSREMVLVLGSALDLPLRERNHLLAAAGFTPAYRTEPLDSPELAPVRAALEVVLARLDPHPVLVLDRLGTVLLLNEGARELFTPFMEDLEADPRISQNVLHGALHPGGLRSSLVNWEEVARFLLRRLTREVTLRPADHELASLLRDLQAYPGVTALSSDQRDHESGQPFITLHLKKGENEVRLFALYTTVGTALDVTAQELVVESYFPADAASVAFLARSRTPR